MSKRIFILNGHPAATSLSRNFAEVYAQEARSAGNEVRITHLHDLQFDSDFGVSSFKDAKPLEPSLEKVMQDIEWSEHIVLATPMWWGGLPAKLKGLFDRAFLPGRTFDTRSTKAGLPLPMLSGRTARLILTSDTPGWFLRLVYKNAMLWQLRKQILGFVGIKPTKVTYFAGASHPRDGQVESWMTGVARLGAQGA
ncbi:flavodoxin family protein [Rhodobacteraceae bacterium RKSG542]|uniref:NAD(P)H-dependent oxidoreductase n=1 Tax=Pseudovibrio flavus TaxID=2529854 RepID=UPI0012BD5A06|nr:NAD(P)H-dependent oxidoreductase [Pseudovibrio flavus]MTI16962.1 flavodoxin family protein [Pseudovibrio flavus]